MLDRAANDQNFEKALQNAMLSFVCDQDTDIQDFMRNKAVTFQQRKLCSVYLLFDQDKLDNSELKIEAYFTLSHKSMVSEEQMSKSKIQKYAGFKDAPTLNFVLIGQLGKWVERQADGTYLRSEITSSSILDYAFDVICSSSELIPCRCVLVECSDETKVRRAYESYGFSFFQNDGSHNQYVKLVPSVSPISREI